MAVAQDSAGKSLVAEVLMIRRILATGKKALLVLPYVALCSEKVRRRGFFLSLHSCAAIL